MGDPRLADIIRTGKQTEKVLFVEDKVDWLSFILGALLTLGVIWFCAVSLDSAMTKEVKFTESINAHYRGAK